MAGTCPRGSPRGSAEVEARHTRACCRKGNTQQAFPSRLQQWESDNTEVLASSSQAGLPDSLANAGESSQIGGVWFYGEVIAPDFSGFLPFDRAAACFRSSLFLA